MQLTPEQKILLKINEYKFACEDYGLSTFNKYKGFVIKSQFDKLPKLSATEKWFFEIIQKEDGEAVKCFINKMHEIKHIFNNQK